MKFTMEVRHNMDSDSPGAGKQIHLFLVPDDENATGFLSRQHGTCSLYEVAPEIAAQLPEGGMFTIEFTPKV